MHTQLQGLPAPFILAWLPIWVFSALAGFATAFIQIADIDNRLRYPFIAKPIIGLATGLAVALYINGETHPPPSSLASWAFIASLCSTPIITGLLVFISDQKRQNELYQSAQDKFIPWSKGGKDDV